MQLWLPLQKDYTDEGFIAMPHIPARIIKNKFMLNDWISMYQNEAGVNEALLLAGGSTKPVGDYDSSIQLIESGLFDKAGFRRLHVAGHPEGNSKDIDPNGGTVKCFRGSYHGSKNFLEERMLQWL